VRKDTLGLIVTTMTLSMGLTIAQRARAADVREVKISDLNSLSGAREKIAGDEACKKDFLGLYGVPGVNLQVHPTHLPAPPKWNYDIPSDEFSPAMRFLNDDYDRFRDGGYVDSEGYITFFYQSQKMHSLFPGRLIQERVSLKLQGPNLQVYYEDSTMGVKMNCLYGPVIEDTSS
jgi:hypothetical protein